MYRTIFYTGSPKGTPENVEVFDTERDAISAAREWVFETNGEAIVDGPDGIATWRSDYNMAGWESVGWDQGIVDTRAPVYMPGPYGPRVI